LKRKLMMIKQKSDFLHFFLFVCFLYIFSPWVGVGPEEMALWGTGFFLNSSLGGIVMLIGSICIVYVVL